MIKYESIYEKIVLMRIVCHVKFSQVSNNTHVRTDIVAMGWNHPPKRVLIMDSYRINIFDQRELKGMKW